MDIYPILSSKPHNQHYLNRYIKYIKGCEEQNNSINPVYVEEHHICPKAKDMFPEYNNFSIHNWNKVKLTPRQHFIAHILLWKTYPNINSQRYALWSMKHQNNQKINSRLYEKLRLELIDTISKSMKGKVTVIDETGNFLKVSVEDEKYITGEYKHNTKGKITVRNLDGKSLQISISEYCKNLNHYTPVNKGKVVVKDADGKVFQIDVQDNRYADGQLVYYATGITRSDDFKLKQSIAHSGKVNIRHKQTGKVVRVDKCDPKVSSDLYEPMNQGKKHSKESKIKRSKALLGKQKEKTVCRLDNKKEMTLANFNKWINGSYNNSGPKNRICRIFDKKEMSINHYTRWLKRIEVATHF